MDLDLFKSENTIDPGQLDVEAVVQAERFFKWGEESVKARVAFDRAKAELDLIESKLIMRARKDPAQFGLEKVTEAGLNAAVKRHSKVREANEKLLVAREEMLLLEMAVQSLEQRKRMIEVLITLHGQEYFAGPSVPRDLVSAWKDHRSKERDRVESLQRDRTRTRKRRTE